MKRFAVTALVVMLGVGATASSTQAAVFHLEAVPKLPVLILGVGPGSSSKITTDDMTITCRQTFFGATTGFLKTVWTKDSSQLNIAPTYSECTYGGGLSAAYIHTTGCRVRFSVGEEIGSGTYNGTLGIVNTGECVNNEIYVERGICRWSFPVQEGHATVEYSNTEYSPPKKTTVEAVAAKLTVTGLEYSLSGVCSAKDGSYSDGKWQETVTLFAEEESGTPLNFIIQ